MNKKTETASRKTKRSHEEGKKQEREKKMFVKYTFFKLFPFFANKYVNLSV